jgi:hypothetical protein
MTHSKERMGKEMSLITNEVSLSYGRVQSEQGSRRFNFLAAQAAFCMHCMKTMMDLDDNWSWFPDFVTDQREEALSSYREAREDGDRERALLMLAQLRLATTLARRLADGRRAKFFVDEPKAPDPMQEENLWSRELALITEESLATHQRFERQGKPALALMALAQVYLGNDMIKQMSDAEDWSWFKDSVYDYLETETERYRRTRAAGDRKQASVMLARVRFAKTLAARLENPVRQAWIARLWEPAQSTH